MRSSIGWYNPDTLSTLLLLAILSVIGVNAELDLCNQFKTGIATITVMAETNEDIDKKPKQFLLLDTNYSGYLVPFSKFQDQEGSYNGTEEPFINLVGAETFHLDGANSLPKRINGKGAFLLASDLKSSETPWVGNFVSFLSPDKKQITMVPLPKGAPKTYSISSKNASASDIFFSTTHVRAQVIAFQLKEKRLVSQGVTTTGFTTVKNVTATQLTAIDGGFIWAKQIGIAYNNEEKNVIIFKNTKGWTVFKVPFEKFFLCPAVAQETSERLSDNPGADSFDFLSKVVISMVLLIMITLTAVLACCLLRLKKKNNKLALPCSEKKVSMKQDTSTGSATSTQQKSSAKTKALSGHLSTPLTTSFDRLSSSNTAAKSTTKQSRSTASKAKTGALARSTLKRTNLKRNTSTGGKRSLISFAKTAKTRALSGTLSKGTKGTLKRQNSFNTGAKYTRKQGRSVVTKLPISSSKFSVAALSKTRNKTRNKTRQ